MFIRIKYHHLYQREYGYTESSDIQSHTCQFYLLCLTDVWKQSFSVDKYEYVRIKLRKCGGKFRILFLDIPFSSKSKMGVEKSHSQ